MISFALVCILFSYYGWGPLVRALRLENALYFWLTVALIVACQAIGAYRWQLVAKVDGLSGKFREYCAFYFVGAFTNLFVPGLLGGDAARTAYLGVRHKALAKAAASVVVDRLTGLATLTWLAATASWIIGRRVFPWNIRAPIVAAGLVSLGLALLSPTLVPLVERLPARIVAIRDSSLVYLRNPLALLPAITVSLVLQLLLIVGQFLLAVGMSMKVPFPLFLLVVPVSNVFASIPVTLNGLGLREGAYLYLFRLANPAPPDTLIALGLLWFGASSAAGLTGVLAFVVAGRFRSPSGPEARDSRMVGPEPASHESTRT